MCFSASASFTASVLLTLLSLLAFKQAKHRATLLLACSPLMFAFQQASEGFLWLSLTNSAWLSVHLPAMYFFLFCALSWWPVWSPFVLMLLEPHIVKRKILMNLFAFGAFFSLYMLYCLIAYGATASIEGCHIYYLVTIPGQIYTFMGVLYLIPTLIPFFISSIWGMQMLGVAITASYLLSYVFYRFCFLSVWCFFAAVLSMMILVIVNKIENEVE